MKTKLQKLIDKNGFNWVNSDITETNFPIPDRISKDFKLFHFNRQISSNDAIKEIEKEGYVAANIYELFSWNDWNKKDWIVALGSVAELYGDQLVGCLSGSDSERCAFLGYYDGGWGGDCRFLAVRTVLKNSKLSPSDSLTLGNFVLRTEFEEFKSKLEKII